MRVGELDEEMVFESRTGDTFILGASTWRIDEITHDRVLVSAAPGQPGKMPFWHGDNAGRPLEFGRRIGQLVREIRDMPRNAALSRLIREHDLDTMAAENLIRFLADQEIATTVVPDDRNIVIERTRDEMGDWRVCVLTPFGSRIHAPWAMAISGRIRASGGADVEAMWGDDGFVLRFPDSDVAPDSELILIDPEEATDLVLRQLSGTALFAAKFARAQRGRCCCRDGGRKVAHPCGSGGSGHTIFSLSLHVIPRSPFCWKPIASACEMFSMCRR